MTRSKGASLLEDPRIADRTSGNRDSIDAGEFDHVEASLGVEQIAATEYGAIAGVLFELAEKFPARWAIVTLLDGPPVDGDRRNAQLVGAVKDFVEIVTAFVAVVDAATHFYGDGNVRGNRVAYSRDNFECDRRLAKMKAATATAKDFFHRTAEVDVDHIEAMFDESNRGRAKLLGVGAHELTADRVFVVSDMHEVVIFATIANLQDELVEHHFADGIGSPESSRDKSHRGIAVATERSLHDREVELDRADLKWFCCLKHVKVSEETFCQGTLFDVRLWDR